MPEFDQTVVVKLGGSTLGARDTTLSDIAALHRRGVPIVVVHGGAWWHGEKGENAYASQWLAARGNVVLDIQYHLAPVADWRSPVADVRHAVDLSLIHI